MRPDKPGPWLFDAVDSGTPWCVQVLASGELVFPGFSVRFKNPAEFERANMFVRWLGPAVPPKPLTRYSLTDEPDSEMVASECGELVKYSDVAEYDLLKHEEE